MADDDGFSKISGIFIVIRAQSDVGRPSWTSDSKLNYEKYETKLNYVQLTSGCNQTIRQASNQF